MVSAIDNRTILIIGSGFSGSLLAAILAKSGIKVILIDRQSHPRFAIGESSTPTATFILKSLIKRYELTELESLTRYGLWKQERPEISCGAKRGFSYFFHSPGALPQTTDTHDQELLVAASNSHATADTHWYRQDVDNYLFEYAQRSGAICICNSEILSAELNQQTARWQIQLNTIPESYETDWIIDASGQSQVMCRLTNIPNKTELHLETNTAAIYGHFEKVHRYDVLLEEAGMDLSDFPFPSDDAAQHHLMDHQWLWSLRFDNGITSLGLMVDLNHGISTYESWQSMLDTYPAISQMVADASLHEATSSLLYSGRLQHIAPCGYGQGWIALPHTIGFIDPLHSTGIAHSLSGVERLANILTDYDVSQQQLRDYSAAVYRELRLIDKLVAGCYKLMPSKPHFEAYCMLYFTAAHNYETCRMASDIYKPTPGIFLSDNADMIQLIEHGYTLASELATYEDWGNIGVFEQQIKNLIAPFDQIGLCNPELHSMYAYTAVL